MKWYYESVGRNTNLLLGMVIDNRGLIPAFDVKTVEEFGKYLQMRFDRSLPRAARERLLKSNSPGHCSSIPSS
nr:hypothetical protein [Candidatus Sigynarchaeota archaeon]